MWSAVVALGKKALMNLARNLAINSAQNGGIGKALKNAVGIVLFVVVLVMAAVPLMTFQFFGNLLCTFSDCDEETGKVEDVISVDMMEKISERMEDLRRSANRKVTIKGQNYGYYKLKILDDLAFSEDETNDGSTGEDSDAKSEYVESGNSQSSYPQADPSIWVEGDTVNVNYGLMMRLAAVGEHYGKVVTINSGWRSFEEQKKLYDCYKAGVPGCNLAANPMYDTHVMGLAVDVSGWLRNLPGSELAQFGLAKEVPGEPWHIWGTGIYYIPKEERMYYEYDGYGVPQELLDAMLNGTTVEGEVSQPGGGSSGDRKSEAYIHLLALGQMDDLSFGALDEDDLEEREKEGTNFGKTWKLAKAIKEEIEDGSYYDDEMIERAEDEEWGTRQYMKLARWEIQKCFLVGDEDVGFWENLLWFVGQEPCANIKELTGEDIVPEKLQGVISKTTNTTTSCVNAAAIYNYDTRNISGVTAEQIESVLRGLLKGYGPTYIEIGNKYGVDPAFLAALTMAETGGNSNALETKNNVGGLMGPNGLKTFSSITESIDYLAWIITNGRYYHNAGLYTVEQIHTVYSPEGASNDPNNLNVNWVSTIYKFMEQMGVELTPVSSEETVTTQTCSTTEISGTALAYPDVKEMLYSYEEISLVENKEDFEPSLTAILDNLYTRQVGSSDLSNSMLAQPNFIVPLEEGTYEVSTKFGSQTDEGISQGTILKVGAKTPIYSAITGSVVSVWDDTTGKKVILLKSPTYGYIEYKGISESLVAKGDSVLQGVLIGAVTDSVEIKICTKASEDNPKPVCIDSYDPTQDPAKLTFSSSGIDKKLLDERAKDYEKWKQSSDKVFMPGYSSYSTLGKLSEKYETNGKYDICIMDTVGTGGLSCGGYQIANEPGTLKDFVEWTASNYPQFYKYLKGVPRTLNEFSVAWKAAYNSDPLGFKQCQHDFIAATHYQVQVDKLQKDYGIDLNTRSNTLRDVIWSYAVQHNHHTQDAWSTAIGKNWTNMTDKEMIEALYAYRLNRWSSLSTRYNNELKDALAMLEAEGWTD